MAAAAAAAPAAAAPGRVRHLPFNPSGIAIYNTDAPWAHLRAQATAYANGCLVTKGAGWDMGRVGCALAGGGTEEHTVWMFLWSGWIKAQMQQPAFKEIELRDYWRDWWLQADAAMAWCLRNGPVVAEADLLILCKDALYNQTDFHGNRNVVHHVLRQLDASQLPRMVAFAKAAMGDFLPKLYLWTSSLPPWSFRLDWAPRCIHQVTAYLADLHDDRADYIQSDIARWMDHAVAQGRERIPFDIQQEIARRALGQALTATTPILPRRTQAEHAADRAEREAQALERQALQMMAQAATLRASTKRSSSSSSAADAGQDKQRRLH